MISTVLQATMSRDPFYSQITVPRSGVKAGASSFLSPGPASLLSPDHSFVSPPQSKYAVRESRPQQQNGTAKFRSLEVSSTQNAFLFNYKSFVQMNTSIVKSMQNVNNTMNLTHRIALDYLESFYILCSCML